MLAIVLSLYVLGALWIAHLLSRAPYGFETLDGWPAGKPGEGVSTSFHAAEITE